MRRHGFGIWTEKRVNSVFQRKKTIEVDMNKVLENKQKLKQILYPGLSGRKCQRH